MIQIINSFILVFISEMGDKTQLLALVLACRFRKPWTVMLGIFVATILNHFFASTVGVWLGSLVSDLTAQIILAISFFVFGFWMLVPDEAGEIKEAGSFNAFTTTVISFFLAEMGDKTQLATVALAAKYASPWYVTIGSTLGMIASNALAIFFGKKFLRKIPLQWVRRVACAMFLVFGTAVIVGALVVRP